MTISAVEITFIITLIGAIGTGALMLIKLGRFVERLEDASAQIQKLEPLVLEVPLLRQKIEQVEEAHTAAADRHNSDIKELRAMIMPRTASQHDGG